LVLLSTGIVSTVVQDSPHKIFVGCIPNYLNEDQVIFTKCHTTNCAYSMTVFTVDYDVKLVYFLVTFILYSYQLKCYWFCWL